MPLVINKTQFTIFKDMFKLDRPTAVIAGPCSIESREQLENIAAVLAANKIPFIRGGAFKPRTSPYDFQGLGVEGLKLINAVGKEYGLFTVSEIMDTRDVEYGVKYLDIIQVGSRNMTNFSLLKELGKTKHPVLLKRGFMSTLSEFLNAAEYIVSEGNTSLIMCERGVRTFDNATRNMLDIAGIALIKKETSLPVIADLSHSLGRKDILLPVAKAVLALGADGIMLEVHPDPNKALSDQQQQLNPEEFSALMNQLKLYS